MELVRAADIFAAGDLMGVPAFDENSPPGLSALYAVVVANKQAVADLGPSSSAPVQRLGRQEK
jgi:hypothetical protein